MAAIPRHRPPTPQATFDRVAPRYDLLNGCLSLGLDRAWRRRAARDLGLRPGRRILDLATGTGSLALALAEAAGEGAHVVGFDRNAAMLRVGRARVADPPARARIHLLQARAEALPFPDGHFDAAALAFAVDDFEDQRAAMAEAYRVLRPAAPIAVLELSVPTVPVLRAFHRAYLRLMPLVDRAWTTGGGYAHLREEIVTYRGREAVEGLLDAAGFAGYRRVSLTGGIAMLHLSHRPAVAAGRREHVPSTRAASGG
jgi:demethylmenaquinone methyltransferase/2-methoxy-6-polyprenyl-1,4-benzoquinol methylase